MAFNGRSPSGLLFMVGAAAIVVGIVIIAIKVILALAIPILILGLLAVLIAFILGKTGQ